MGLSGTRTYVGFGFGAIQSGLFVYEAFQSGAFRRLVVAEVLPEVVTAMRRAGGYYAVNIAYPDRVECVRVGPVEIENPSVEEDRARMASALAEADEIGTAVPSVDFYVSKKPGSLHQVLADGLERKTAGGGPRAVVYAAENHNRAAEILQAHVGAELPESMREAVLGRVRFLNTVIGKMSQVVTAPQEIETRDLVTITPDIPRAFLVESFNKILISKIRFDRTESVPPFQRGISVFQEKEDLLPFEEAKLYGHNATHALAGYIGALRGVARVMDLQAIPGAIAFLRAAFIEESGAALIRKHPGVDELFTLDGYREYADDLLERMMSPFLRDTIDRVTRDTERKLAWNDRLIGMMRLALGQGVKPRRFAAGAAAALAVLDPSVLQTDFPIEPRLCEFWKDASPALEEKEQVLDLIQEGRRLLKSWSGAGFPDLERFFS